MLDFLRKRKRSWIITFLLGVIIIVFIAFYGGSKFQDSRLQDLADVNGETISQAEFAEYYQRTLDRYRDALKGSLTPELLKSLNIKGKLIEDLIQKRLAIQEARKLGLVVRDDELANVISQVPEFQVAGRFNKERYVQVLRANRLTPDQFEEDQRQQLTMQRLYSIVLDSVQVTDAELRDRYRLEQEKINLYFIRLPTASFVSQVKLTDEEIKKFYDRSKETFKEPLKVQVEYLSYPFAQFSSGAPVTEQEIKDYYQANQAKFRSPKQAKVRTISIPLAPPADAKQKEAAMARARRILADARAGKDFAQLAPASNDPAAPRATDIGWVQKGQLPAIFDNPVFNLAKGAVSDIIDTPNALQIAKVDDVKEEKNPTLSEATNEITRILKTEKGKREAATAADRDREKALSGADLTKLAQQGSVSLNMTRLFSNGEVLPEIGQNQEFYKNAFSMSLKDISPVIEGSNSYYLMRLKDRKEPAVQPLEAVRPTIEKQLTESKAYELARQKGLSLVEQLKKERDIAKVAEANALKLEETGWFLRNAPQIPKVGQLPEGAVGIALSAQKPVTDKVYTQKDAVYVFAFKESQSADMDQFEKQKDQLAKQALTEAKQRVAQKFMEDLKANAKIHINPSVLEEANG